MRIALSIIALGMVAFGLWLIATGFISEDPAATTSAHQVTSVPQASAGPVALGVAILAGGVLFFFMVLRR